MQLIKSSSLMIFFPIGFFCFSIHFLLILMFLVSYVFFRKRDYANFNGFDNLYGLVFWQGLNQETGALHIPPLQYNLLDEPSPLGLQLKKSPSFLDLIQMRLTQGNGPKLGSVGKKVTKGTPVTSASEKLKASNFAASILRIGKWEVHTFAFHVNCNWSVFHVYVVCRAWSLMLTGIILGCSMCPDMKEI